MSGLVLTGLKHSKEAGRGERLATRCGNKNNNNTRLTKTNADCTFEHLDYAKEIPKLKIPKFVYYEILSKKKSIRVKPILYGFSGSEKKPQLL